MMKVLSELIIDINYYNEEDDVNKLLSRSALNVTIGIDNYIELHKQYGNLGDGTFLITDNLSAKSKAIFNGIGFSVYSGKDVDPAQFPEALYCIEVIKDMEDITLNRMYERANDIPWTILETDRCIVREMTVEDVDRLYEIYSDSDTKRYIDDLYEDYDREVQFMKDYIANQYRFFEYGLWGVVHKESGMLIGRAGIFDRDNQDETELGFVFDRKFWGQGYALEVLEAIISYATSEIGITTLVAHVMEPNSKSKVLLRKLGFIRNGDATIDGKIYETHIR